MMKSERDEMALQQQVFEKITSTARAEDDFSIHMIEEASLQRLQALSTQLSHPAEKSVEKSFPLSGGLQTNNAKPKQVRSSSQLQPATEPKIKRSTSTGHRQARLKKRIDGKMVEDQKRHRRNRKMISEVRKRVQEAHQTQHQERIPLSSTNHNVPLAYKGRKLVYTRGGQVPQFRNGDLDWNYLWFFSDSSSATNSTNSSSLNQNQSESSLNQTSLSVDSSTDSAAAIEAAIAPPPTQISLTPPPNPKNVKNSSSPTVSIVRQATKKRIRRLAAHPPQDDDLKLLGMV